MHNSLWFKPTLSYLMLSTLCGFPLVNTGRANDSGLTADDLKVLATPASDMMKDYLTELVDKQFAARTQSLAQLSTAEDWARRAEAIRESIKDWTGPFPTRAPLQAIVTGRLDRPDYVMEKILFESRPGFLVSANLYLPKGELRRRPAVLNVIGHSPEGKAADKVQRRSIAQAKKGFVALTIDGVGQGERQIPDYESYGGPPGNAHQIIGRQAFLAGTHVFNLMAWDAIRAVDYLVSRAEVDPDRIACTGCSGGGMLTTYILPLEPRIAVAIPACNPNTWSHRVHAELSCDHEQVFAGAFAAGIDPRGDPLFCQLPKPLLINATSGDDLNPPQGVWELSRWLEKAYVAHQHPERFKTTMIDAPHGYNLEQREIAYAWMLKWLGGDESHFEEGDFQIEDESDTWCTPQGNVYSGGRSVQPHALVLEHLSRHRPTWLAVTNPAEFIEHKARLERVCEGVFGLPSENAIPEVTTQATRASGELRFTPVVLHPEDGIVLPGMWVEANDGAEQGRVILYLHDRGKAKLAEEEIVRRLVLTEGFRILAVDLRGSGETAPGLENKFWGFLAGKPIFSQRVADVRSILSWLAQPEVGATEVQIWATGVTAACATIASVNADNVSGLLLDEPLLSFESIVSVRVPTYREEILVADVLENLDLAQVYQAACPKRISLLNPLRGDKSYATREEASETYQSVSESYQALGSPTRWRVIAQSDSQQHRQWLLAHLIDAN